MHQQRQGRRRVSATKHDLNNAGFKILQKISFVNILGKKFTQHVCQASRIQEYINRTAFVYKKTTLGAFKKTQANSMSLCP